MQDQIIIAELNRIAEGAGGRLLPRDVVKAAEPDDSLLHSKFEWDDTAAARKYRLDQARALIRVCVEYYAHDSTQKRINAFVSLSPDRRAGGGYRQTRVVLAMNAMRDQLVRDAQLEMDRFRAKYASISELAAVIDAMDRAAQSLKQSAPKATRRRKTA